MEELFSNTKKPEYIICSAIYFKDGKKYEEQPKNIVDGFVVCGRRHSNCYITAWALSGSQEITDKMNEVNGKCIHGFLTSKNNFMNREEAGKLAFDMKQIDKPTNCLFSEDLY